MRNCFNALLAAVAATFIMAGPAQANLLGRDINGLAVAGSDGSAVFLYDTDLKITWLRDANVNGAMYWADANTWAGGYSIGGYDDWRLPTVADTANDGCTLSYAGGTDCGFNVNTGTSETAHLWYTELGNLAYCPPGDTTCAGGPQTGWGLTNVGDFLNMQSDYYWAGTGFAPNPFEAWYFRTSNGYQLADNGRRQFYAMAVRPGDVLAAPVPEPETYAMMLAGLGLIAGLARRRSKQAGGISLDRNDSAGTVALALLGYSRRKQ